MRLPAILKSATSAVAAAPIIDAVNAAAKETDMAITDELLVANRAKRGDRS